jgi:hypothetical protein
MSLIREKWQPACLAGNLKSIKYKRAKNHAHFPGKNLFIALHHGSDFILINKTMILLHKYS